MTEVSPKTGRFVVELPPDEEMGPALRALPTEQMKRFVIAVVRGAVNPTQAVKAAGYKNSEGGHRVAAHRLMRDERVLRAITEESRRVLSGAAPIAIKALLEIAGDKKSKDRFKAASDILDRIGYPKTSIQQHDVTVKDERSNDDLLRMIREKLAALGGQGVALPAPDVIEGEVVEVGDAAEA